MGNDNTMVWVIGAALVLWLLSNKSTTATVVRTTGGPIRATNTCMGGTCFGVTNANTAWCC